VDDLGVDAEGVGVFDELVLEAGIYPGFYYRGVVGLGLPDCGYSGVVVSDGGGEDDYGEEEAERVGDDGPLPADYFLVCVNALGLSGDVGGGLDALGVDDGGGGFGVAAGLLAGEGSEVGVELREDAFVAPGGVVVGRVPWIM
jgi:hypothetical protein